MKKSNIVAAIIFILCLPGAALAGNLNEKIDHFQDLFGNPSSNTKITKTEYNQGETRPKAILKGVFYIGGSDQKRKLLSGSYQQLLCGDQFSRVYSVYKQVDKEVSCSGNSYSYSFIGQASDGGGSQVKALMGYLYNNVINGEEGAVFLHCHYGVHASNTIAQMVLMQFCGVSASQAKKNWDAIDLYDSLGKEGTRRQFEKIDSFKPYPEYQITEAQKNAICY